MTKTRDLADLGGGFIQAGTGAVQRTVESKLQDVVSVKDFGAVGNGVTDDTAAIQAALNAATGKSLVFDGGSTYNFTALRIPSNIAIYTYGASLVKTTNDVNGIRIPVESNIYIDSLNVSCSWDSSGGQRVLYIVPGSNNIRIDNFSAVCGTDGDGTSVSYAVEIGNDATGSAACTNVSFGRINVENLNTAVFARNCRDLHIESLYHNTFRLSVNFVGCINSTLSNAKIEVCSISSKGDPGDNGFLCTSSQEFPTRDIRVTNVSVESAGEHGFRLAGSWTMQNVWFTNCRSRRSGYSIVINDPAATEWHGGCGFKVLGPTQIAGQKHRNIFFDNCVVEDIEDTYGTFPAGHGTLNHSGFYVGVASNVHISNCSVTRNSNTTYACGVGIAIIASDNVYVNNCRIEDTYDTSALVFDSTFAAGVNPGWDIGNTDIYFDGCKLGTSNPTLTNVVSIGNNGADYDYSNINLKNCELSGAAHGLRVEPLTGTGTYSDLFFNFVYKDSTENYLTSLETPLLGDLTQATLDVEGEWHPVSTGNMPCKLGSKFKDVIYGNTYTRRTDGWDPGKLTISIDNDSVIAIKAPGMNDTGTGFISLAAGGTNYYGKFWYRTSTPASAKLAGTVGTVIVNTALNGTSGTVGDITVGIQTDFIYIENRAGVTQSVNISFT